MRHSSARAFSLLEAMLAVALVVALSGGVFAFLFNLGRQRDGVERATGALRGAAALLEGLEGDALGVIADDGSGNSGIVGTETTLEMLTRGVAPPVLGAGVEGVVGDLQGVEYRFDEQAGTLSARRWGVVSSGGDAGGSGNEDAESVLAEGVSRVRLRYFNGTTWRSSFDSARDGGLPVAIEVAVWFGGAASEGGEEDFGPASASGEEGLDDAGFPDDLPPADEEELAPGPDEELLPPPDRVRIIVIPDGPVSAWREGP